MTARRHWVIWVCRRCGLGLVWDDEPAHCGCYRGRTLDGDEWEFERIEVEEVLQNA